MRKTILTGLAAITLAACETPQKEKTVEMKTLEDSASYAIGITIGNNLAEDFKNQKVDSVFDHELLLSGLSTALASEEGIVGAEDARGIVNRFFEGMTAKRGEANRKSGADFLAKNADKKGVMTTESGLQYIVLKEGEGEAPTASDKVMVHYTGKLLDGTVFDSSYDRGEPAEFYVRQVIPGWTEALQLMKPMAEYKLFIPSDLAYGENGNPRGGIGPNEVLVFDVKLIEVLPEE